MEFAYDVSALPGQLFQFIQVAIKEVGHIGTDECELRAAVHTYSDTSCGGLTEGGGMLCTAAGASHHAFIGPLRRCWSRLLSWSWLLSRYFTHRNAGSCP